MMKTSWMMWMVAAMVGFATLAFSVPVRAEGGLTLDERVERLERRQEAPPAVAADTGLADRIKALEERVKNFPFGLKLGGILATSYLYNFNDPDSDRVNLRAFDKRNNTFSLDLFQLQVSRAPGEEGVGFVVKVDFGKVAEGIASDWDGDGTVGNVSEENNSVELQDAYITYNPPVLPELGFKVGKFATLLGAEVIESPLNYNITRSLAYTFAIPITNTGALVSYAFTDWVSLTAGAVNGWDNVIDSNDGKSVIGSLAVTPVEQFAFSVNGIYGPEQADDGHSKRGVVDVVATVKPIDNLVLQANYDYGNESHLGLGRGAEEWQAISTIVAYDLVDVLPLPIGLAVRGEYFDDSDGARLTLGTTDVAAGPYQNDWEVTGTLKFVLAEGLMLRAEYRYDAAKHDLFDYRRGVSNSDDQQTVAGELSYVF